MTQETQRNPVGNPSDAGLAATPRQCPLPTWARRAGLAAFVFFLIKGLAWLLVPALLVWWGS